MNKKDKIIEIGILISPHAQTSSVYGLGDLFSLANTFMAQHASLSGQVIRITHWKFKDAKAKNIECVFDTHSEIAEHHIQFLVVPPSLGDLITPIDAGPWARWVSTQHSSGATICSICSGAFLVAESGVLNGRRATTHWSYGTHLAKRFPELEVDINKLIIDDGDVITAGGLMAWVDLGLRLVDRLFGSTVMLQTARFMLVDPSGREQQHYSNFSPILHHGDEEILKVQHWLQGSGSRTATVSLMAKKAGMEERTFLRRFQRATEMKPTEYCQHLRVGKAREALEFTKKNIDQIAWAVGYEDTGSFRKVFQKIVGITPGEYRNRFGMMKK
jgi:transcriptional regulator GlxA family with amidase domain